jgi:radical SAM-linked protein
MEKCTHNCGICDTNCRVVKNIIQTEPETLTVAKAAENAQLPDLPENKKNQADTDVWRILFSFSKKDGAVFHGHLSLIEIFCMAFMRADIPVTFTNGFNPLPKLEFCSPISLGIFAEGEIAAVETTGYFSAEKFKDDLNTKLPPGIRVVEAQSYLIPKGTKKYSVSSLLWGYAYAASVRPETEPESHCDPVNADFVKALDEKKYRLSRTGEDGSVYGLQRLAALAKYPNGKDTEKGESYFTVYRKLYPEMN